MVRTACTITSKISLTRLCFVAKTSSNHQSAKAQTDMESRKGTAAQSGMFRQLTGGLESVITAIVEAYLYASVHY